MFDLPLISFDIETTPNPDMGRAHLGFDGDNASIIRQMMAARAVETQGRTEYPAQPWHRVICVCVTVLDPKTGSIEMLPLGSDDLWDERSHVEEFFAFVEKRGKWGSRDSAEAADLPSRLVSWNGSGFDLPILRYRAMAHGIIAADFNRTGGNRKYDHYFARFGNLHVDVMDELSSYGASPRAGLDAVAKSLGLPSKEFLSKPIHEHLIEGDHVTIVEYCKLDTLVTLLAYLSWGRHAGWVQPEAYEQAMAEARACVAKQEHPGWREVTW